MKAEGIFNIIIFQLLLYLQFYFFFTIEVFSISKAFKYYSLIFR